MSDELDTEVEWQVATDTRMRRASILLTDLPHPDKPDEDACYVLDLGAEIDRLAEHLQLEHEAAEGHA